MKKSRLVATIMTAVLAFGMLPGLVSQADDTPRIDITIEPGFLSEAFEAEDDYYYFSDRDNPEGLPNTTDDVDANITVTAGGDVIPCNMIYFFNLHDAGGHKMFSINYIPDDVNYYEFGDSLIVTLNGVPLSLYSEPVASRQSYLYQNSEDCVVSFGYNGTFSIDFRSTLIEGIDMFRLYNSDTGEHLYTADAGERDWLRSIGWNYEGVGWTAPAMSNTPVYRLFNDGNGEHLYIADLGEISYLVNHGWTNEGRAFYSDDYRIFPIYRLFNPNEVTNNHHFTTDVGERDWLDSIGWNYEGVALYGVA